MIRQVFDIAANPEGPAGSGGEGTLGEAESFSTSGLAAAAADSVHQALRVCGVTALSARKVFIEVEGIDNLEALGTLNGDTDVTEMAKRMASRSANAGKVILGTMQIKRLQALVYWVKDHEKRQITLDADLWTPEELKSTIARKEAEHNFEKVDVAIVDPGKCRTDVGWDSWQIGFMNKLSSTLGTAKVPLAYVVRDDRKNIDDLIDDDMQRMHQMPLHGENFKRDSKLVYNMLKSACIDTDAWTWIQDNDAVSNGRKAWLALVAHYDGSGELNKRMERAKEEISRLHYKDEKSFPFERYVTKLKENFYILGKDKDEALTGRQQVDIMLKGIKSLDATIVAAKTNVFKDFRSDFAAATAFLSGLISNVHSGAQVEYANRNVGKRRYISAMGTHERGGRGRFKHGGRFGERSSGRGRANRGTSGRGNSQKVQINGVDVSDPARNFTSDEWERLGNARAFITQQRSRSRRGGRGGYNRDNINQRNASASNVSETTAGNTTINQTDSQSQGNTTISERGSQNGRSFGRGAYSS